MLAKGKTWSPTRREQDVLEVLWTGEKPMTASEIVNANPELTMNTVQAVLRKLLGQKIIEVADIVYSGTVLSRSYRPLITHDEFISSQFSQDLERLNKTISKPSLLKTLFDAEKDRDRVKAEIEELEQMLDEYRKKLQ